VDEIVATTPPSDDWLIDQLSTTRDAVFVRFLSAAVVRGRVTRALPALARVPDVRDGDCVARTEARRAASLLLETLSADELESLSLDDAAAQALVDEHRSVRRLLGSLPDAVRGLADGDPDRQLESVRKIAALGAGTKASSRLQGAERAEVVARLSAIVDGNARVDVRRSAHDTLRAIGESVGGFLP
jgi:hypothetical protein